jgi:ZIP family zinc transporter
MSQTLALLLLGLATGAMTLAGGALALGLAGRLHLILGFSAGAVIGVALLDLMPECMALQAPGGATTVAGLMAVGFFVYLSVDRVLLAVSKGDPSHRGHFGAGALATHSLLDGLGIGLGFQASASVGLVIAAAVLAHDLADGVNTVGVSLDGSRSPRVARRWLLVDAAAPIAGIALSRFVVLPQRGLAVVLGLIAGAFLYIGASELLPESHHRHPRPWTTIATGLGLGLIWLVVRLAEGL